MPRPGFLSRLAGTAAAITLYPLIPDGERYEFGRDPN